MIRVEAASRLHFGLFALPREEFWPNREGELRVPVRRFGGVGLMIEAPGVAVAVRPAVEWSASGPLAEKALEPARRTAERLSIAPHHIQVERCAPHHAGLGTGTQLALAVGQAVLASGGRQPPVENGLPIADHGGLTPPARQAITLAGLVGRGKRSAIGVHGFAQGGFLVEGGQRRSDQVSPLLARCDFPTEWPIVLAIPGFAQGLHGQPERSAFERLLEDGAPAVETDVLCRLALLGMLPALAERDWQALGEALYDFNHRVGLLFAAVQGGPYAHPRLAELVAFIRQQGVAGTGQSSWGPAVFAVACDSDQAGFLGRKLRERFCLSEHEVLVTTACNTGARLQSS